MSLQHPVEPDELNAIQRRFGAVTVEHATLTVADPFLTGEHQMLTSDGRRAEICYVMHRGDPADGVLLHIKRFYPEGAFRLPTGGIHLGEAVIETLSREIYEETGLTVGDGPAHVVVERFWACWPTTCTTPRWVLSTSPPTTSWYACRKTASSTHRTRTKPLPAGNGFLRANSPMWRRSWKPCRSAPPPGATGAAIAR